MCYKDNREILNLLKATVQFSGIIFVVKCSEFHADHFYVKIFELKILCKFDSSPYLEDVVSGGLVEEDPAEGGDESAWRTRLEATVDVVAHQKKHAELFEGHQLKCVISSLVLVSYFYPVKIFICSSIFFQEILFFWDFLEHFILEKSSFKKSYFNFCRTCRSRSSPMPVWSHSSSTSGSMPSMAWLLIRPLAWNSANCVLNSSNTRKNWKKKH